MRNVAFPVDLDRYFARIGHAGTPSPDLTTLGSIIARHAASIPFEAIDVLLSRRIDLSPAAVDAKLIERRRGGYCFEQNGLLQRVLASLGYRVEPLMARVLWMRHPGAAPPAWSHMALRVFVEDVGHLVDVGFGSCVPTAPLRFDRSTPQPTPHGPFRLSRRSKASCLKQDLVPAGCRSTRYRRGFVAGTPVVARTSRHPRIRIRFSGRPFW